MKTKLLGGLQPGSAVSVLSGYIYIHTYNIQPYLYCSTVIAIEISSTAPPEVFLGWPLSRKKILETHQKGVLVGPIGTGGGHKQILKIFLKKYTYYTYLTYYTCFTYIFYTTNPQKYLYAIVYSKCLFFGDHRDNPNSAGVILLVTKWWPRLSCGGITFWEGVKIDCIHTRYEPI